MEAADITAGDLRHNALSSLWVNCGAAQDMYLFPNARVLFFSLCSSKAESVHEAVIQIVAVIPAYLSAGGCAASG